MTITPLNIGTTANDGTGQDLRSGGEVINANFAELDLRTSTAQATADSAGEVAQSAAETAASAQAAADAAIDQQQFAQALDLKVDKVTGKGLSTEDYTTGEKAKLAGLQPGHYRGTFTTLAALQSGVTTPVAGDYGDVDAGVGSDVQRYIWDATDTKWVMQGATGGGPANTDSLPEGTTNRYFTAARVLAIVLSGLSLTTGGAIVSTDSVIAAFGKLQKQITDLAATVANKASSGANNDITSLLALSTALSVAQGGTGAVTVSGAQTALGINVATNIVAGTDLNSIQSTGPYLQQANANATLALNYPVARAGSLTVTNLGAITTQIYVTYDTGAVYSRGRLSGTWSAWTTGGGPFSQEYVSAQQTITPGGTITLAHGLGVVPKLILCQIVCVVANSGYAVGDVIDNIPIQYYTVSSASAMRGVLVQKDSTSVIVQYGNSGNPTIIGMTKGTGVAATFTDTSWRLVVRAYV
jgi:hypothetical protein